MAGPMLTANDPAHWLGWLAASIGEYINGRQDRAALTRDYAAYRRSPCVDDELRKILPEPPKKGTT